MRRYDVDSLDNRDPAALAAFARSVEAVARPYFRAELRGVERAPSGPALYVGNHSGGLVTPDSFLLLAGLFTTAGVDAVPYVLAGDSALRLPGANQLLAPLGAVRASIATATALLERRDKVLVYPGGDRDAMRAYRDRDRVIFAGRTGYIRLALQAGVPIVPVVTAGAHAGLVILSDGQGIARALRANRLLRIDTWPVALCLPWGLVIGPGLLYLPWPTRILTALLEPIHFERQGPAAAADRAYVRACADLVERRMQRALSELAIERRAARSLWRRSA